MKGLQAPSEKGVVYYGPARGSYIISPQNVAVGSPSVSQPYLICGWAKFDNSDTNIDIVWNFGVDSTPYGRRSVLLGNVTSAGRLTITTYGYDCYATAAVSAGVWAHYAFLYNGAQLIQNSNTGLELYKNLAQLAVTATTSALPLATYLSIASAPAIMGGASDALATNSMRGSIHGVVLAKGSVSELKQIMRAHYNNPHSLLAPRRIYIPTAAASAGAPTITALSARLITATSAQPRISYS